MILSQIIEATHASGNHDILTMSVAIVTAAIVVVREIFSLVNKYGKGDEPTISELHRRVKQLENGRQTDQNNIAAARTDIAVVIALLKKGG